MPKYNDAFDQLYFKERKENEWLWSNILNPVYASEIKSKEQFDQQVKDGRREIVRENQRDLIPTYMYHHDLTYSTWLLKAKHNKVNIGIGSVSLIGIVLCCYLIFFASTTVTTEIKTLTGLDLFIGGFMIVGMTIGGLMLVLKFSKLRLLMLCTFVFGCGLIMFREELAMFLLPYLNDYLTFLLLFPLVLMIVYVVLYSKKDKTKQIRTNVR